VPLREMRPKKIDTEAGHPSQRYSLDVSHSPMHETPHIIPTPLPSPPPSYLIPTPRWQRCPFIHAFSLCALLCTRPASLLVAPHSTNWFPQSRGGNRK
jgi:hypothetical protein